MLLVTSATVFMVTQHVLINDASVSLSKPFFCSTRMLVFILFVSRGCKQNLKLRGIRQLQFKFLT
jgi:hypothetical protein